MVGEDGAEDEEMAEDKSEEINVADESTEEMSEVAARATGVTDGATEVTLSVFEEVVALVSDAILVSDTVVVSDSVVISDVALAPEEVVLSATELEELLVPPVVFDPPAVSGDPSRCMSGTNSLAKPVKNTA